jgi:hypothetical protein
MLILRVLRINSPSDPVPETGGGETGIPVALVEFNKSGTYFPLGGIIHEEDSQGFHPR